MKSRLIPEGFDQKNLDFDATFFVFRRLTCSTVSFFHVFAGQATEEPSPELNAREVLFVSRKMP